LTADYDDMEALEQAVEEAPGNLLLTDGGTLRHVGEETRLKALARGRIQERLGSKGLIAIPEVPQYQEERVYVTRIGSDGHKLWAAFVRPDDKNLALVRGSVGQTRQVVLEQDAAEELQELIAEVQEKVAALMQDGGAAAGQMNINQSEEEE
jgi:hypothetical protein